MAEIENRVCPSRSVSLAAGPQPLALVIQEHRKSIVRRDSELVEHGITREGLRVFPLVQYHAAEFHNGHRHDIVHAVIATHTQSGQIEVETCEICGLTELMLELFMQFMA